jgi:hypothetical protein
LFQPSVFTAFGVSLSTHKFLLEPAIIGSGVSSELVAIRQKHQGLTAMQALVVSADATKYQALV